MALEILNLNPPENILNFGLKGAIKQGKVKVAKTILSRSFAEEYSKKYYVLLYIFDIIIAKEFNNLSGKVGKWFFCDDDSMRNLMAFLRLSVSVLEAGAKDWMKIAIRGGNAEITSSLLEAFKSRLTGEAFRQAWVFLVVFQENSIRFYL